jgi:hypothetical protein
MRKTNKLMVALLMTGIVPLWATGSETPRVTMAEGSTLALHGSSTMHDYEARATQMDLKVDVAPEPPQGANTVARLAARGGVQSFVLTVPVLGLHSEKNGLDKNMYKALRASDAPNIVFHMTMPAVTTTTADGVTKVQAKGELEIAGQSRPIDLDVTAKVTPQGVVIDGHKNLLMTTWGIKPPTMMLGTIKTADAIDIVFHLVLPVSGL